MSVTVVFTDRVDAGRVLGPLVADALREIGFRSAGEDRPPLIVVGLARGGVPVGREVANAVDAPLDVLVVRKIGAPGQREFAMGALAAGQVLITDDVPRRLGVSAEQLREIIGAENKLRVQRENTYRAGRQPISFSGRVVVLVDDGIATGATMAVAVRAVRAAGAVGVVVAVPVAPRDAVHRFETDASVDRVVCVDVPAPFRAVGLSYHDFGEVADSEVVACLGA